MDAISTVIEQYVQYSQGVTAFDAPFLQNVGALLGALGYTLQDADAFLLSHVTQKTEEEIKNSCNVTSVPQGLLQCATRLIVAEFLTTKKNMGMLNGFELNFEPALKQLQEGDTTIVWATDITQSPEKRFDDFIGFMRSARGQLVSYRRLKW